MRSVLLLCLASACGAQESRIVSTAVENAAAVAQYKSLLAECRQRGKEARSYEVYAACADAVDEELCRRHSVRCEDAGSQ